MLVQRCIENIGIPTVLIAALPPIAQQQGAPRTAAPRVPMGANAGEPNNIVMQKNILRDSLRAIEQIKHPGTVLSLPYEYIARV